jgi:uncharacterized protein (DUF58 family)
MLNLLLYLLAIGATLYTATIYRGGAMVLLLLVEDAYLLVSIFVLLYQKSKLRFELIFPIPMLIRGQRTTLKAMIHQDGRFPISKMKITLHYRVFGSKKRKKIKLSGMADASSTVSLECNLREEENSTCFFYKASIRIYDPLGAIFITKRIPLKVRLDIMPDIHPVHVVVSDQIHHFMGESDIYDSFRAGDDASEIFRIREFRNGDSIKNIHWKLSAKKEEWMVRENSRQLSCAVVLFWDVSAPEKWKQQDLDAFLSLAFSISFALMEQGCPHFAVWYRKAEEDIVRMRIDDEESLYEFFLAMMTEEPVTTQKDISNLYHEKYKGENWLKEILVNLLQGKKVARLDAKKLKVELESLELTL